MQALLYFRKHSKREYVTSIVGSFFLAWYYAVLENCLDFAKVHEVMRRLFGDLPRLGVLAPYHYIFMFSLFLFVGGLPLLDDIFFKSKELRFLRKSGVLVFGNALFTALVEDIAYFVIARRWIKPYSWTCKIMGYIVLGDVILPTWYLVVAPIIAFCYWYAFR